MSALRSSIPFCPACTVTRDTLGNPQHVAGCALAGLAWVTSKVRGLKSRVTHPAGCAPKPIK